MLPKIKIVCTIGPATWDKNVMRKIIKLGMNIARVNGAFADPDELDKVRKLVRQFSKDVSLMVDVKGPEIRLNKFPEAIKVKIGDVIEIGSKKSHAIYPYNYPNIYKVLKKGNKIVVGDGDVTFTVDKINTKEGIIYAVVTQGELLKPGKALNLVGVSHSEEVLTKKDLLNLRHGLKTGWDMVSASFIQNKKSALQVREVIGDKMKLIAKIEDRQGLENIKEILEVVDGIMVARGGLGVDMGLQHVPIAERELIKQANAMGKPVITATQMLESMTTHPYATRAEINDIETAVLLGTDAVMLSGETASGDYPVEAVETLVKTADFTYKYLKPLQNFKTTFTTLTTLAIANATIELAHDMGNKLKAVVIVSRSGNTARVVVRGNLQQPIYVFTETFFAKQSLNLSKGIRNTFVLQDGPSGFRRKRDIAVKHLVSLIKQYKIAKEGDKVLLVGRTHIHGPAFFPNIFEMLDI